MATQRRDGCGCLTALAVIPLFGVPLFAVVSVIIGISQQVTYNHTYEVRFNVSGQECDPDTVTFSMTDGSVLDCGLKGTVPMGPVDADFPGFSKAQDQAVMALAKQLGGDRIQEDDMSRIQERVDQIADTRPPESRPSYHQGLRIGPLWGRSLAFAGGAVIVAILIALVVLRIIQLQRRPSAASQRA
jgi:hypothetical protein